MERDNEPLRVYEELVSHLTPLTSEREAQLAEIIRGSGPGADSAKRELVEANLGFVIEIAKHYQVAGLGVLELIQRGNDGLIKAAGLFVHGRESRFATFAIPFVSSYWTDCRRVRR